MQKGRNVGYPGFTKVLVHDNVCADYGSFPSWNA